MRRKQDAYINAEAKSKYPLRDLAKTFKYVFYIFFLFRILANDSAVACHQYIIP